MLRLHFASFWDCSLRKDLFIVKYYRHLLPFTFGTSLRNDKTWTNIQKLEVEKIND